MPTNNTSSSHPIVTSNSLFKVMCNPNFNIFLNQDSNVYLEKYGRQALHIRKHYIQICWWMILLIFSWVMLVWKITSVLTSPSNINQSVTSLIQLPKIIPSPTDSAKYKIVLSTFVTNTDHSFSHFSKPNLHNKSLNLLFQHLGDCLRPYKDFFNLQPFEFGSWICSPCGILI